jgi:general secretion pathway protein A
MYEEFLGHFGLQRNPFAVSPNPQTFYSTTVHDEALVQLMFGTNTRQGLMVLTGEPGTGKTTILHYFLDWLQQTQGYSTAYIFHTLLSSLDLLRLILRDFGIPCDLRSKGELLIALMDWLKERHQAGDCPVILIDEAHVLTGAALEEVCMLLNLEIGGVKLVQIVLAGQPLLEEKLRRRHLARLRQRMMCHCQLSPLTLEETTGYIVKRLAWAGSEGSGVFPPGTVREIFKYSKGIPRVINLICEHALLSSYADRRNSVDLNDVVGVAQEFELGGEAEAVKGPSRTNRFFRLIPFPKPTVAELTVRSRQRELEAALTAAWSSGKQHREIASVPAVPAAATPKPVRVPPVAANVLRPAPVISKLGSGAFPHRSPFVLYWRAVGSSLTRDGRQLVAQCLKWLSEPMELRRPVYRSETLPRFRQP